MSKAITLGVKITYANSYWKRLKGLLFYAQPFKDEGLLITPCNSVHMFFMRFPIDVVFLDQMNNVVKVVPNLRPWKIVLPVPHAKSALELPVGTISDKNIQARDQILF